MNEFDDRLAEIRRRGLEKIRIRRNRVRTAALCLSLVLCAGLSVLGQPKAALPAYTQESTTAPLGPVLSVTWSGNRQELEGNAVEQVLYFLETQQPTFTAQQDLDVRDSMNTVDATGISDPHIYTITASNPDGTEVTYILSGNVLTKPDESKLLLTYQQRQALLSLLHIQ